MQNNPVHEERRSMKIELTPEFVSNLSLAEAVEDVFWQGLNLLDQEDSVMDRFFTVRFDQSSNGGISATVSSSRKRG